MKRKCFKKTDKSTYFFTESHIIGG